jgi:peptidylprolyl isomerase
MRHWPKSIINISKRLLKTGILAVLLFSLSIGTLAGCSGDGQARVSRLPPGDPIKDGKALLRYALPIDNEPVREIQKSLEQVSTELRAKRWSAVNSDIAAASRVLSTSTPKILADVPEARKPKAKAILEELGNGINQLRVVAETEDGEEVLEQRAQLLSLVGQIEELMVEDFPFEVPEEYSNLPQLKGRATVEMETEKGTVTMVLDGYSAPVTAGNFVDLVRRGFYDGLQFVRSEASYVLQAGDPPGKEVGFIDPETNEERNVPLEILVTSEKEPIYGFTLEEVGLYREQPVLPFSAYGTVAMARPEDINNGGSSQFFFFLFEPELTPAGLNLLDGRFAVFGYVTEGKDVLRKLKRGDTIISAKVVEGAENLVEPPTAKVEEETENLVEPPTAKVEEETKDLVEPPTAKVEEETEDLVEPPTAKVEEETEDLVESPTAQTEVEETEDLVESPAAS